eukprot:TRINITY_DN10185_c0_g1_i1.p1 TRINITY_DN10185_c0_g1~~TRINITY_DN10185_c0_g1_i1.p1  ORF type:complete len:434 (-),score=67.11 TRINITY_DN10185_c0_g1_i1:220-1521(-)
MPLMRRCWAQAVRPALQPRRHSAPCAWQHLGRGCWLAFSSSADDSGKAAASSSCVSTRLRRLKRGTVVRMELQRDEWLDQLAEWRSRRRRMVLQRWDRLVSLPGALRWQALRWLREVRERCSHDRFDDWFNRRWRQLGSAARARVALLQQLCRGSAQYERAFDAKSMMMIGAGAGSAIQGVAHGIFPPVVAGFILAAVGTVRACYRHSVQRVDGNDMASLIPDWAPAALRKKKNEIYQRFKRELADARAIQRGDTKSVDLHWLDHGEQHRSRDVELDYTPESLFMDAMDIVVKHPRVQETLGEDVRVVAEPDKVVYRVREGVSEVCLAWPVAGSLGSAEVQVMAVATALDFIYIFPASGGRYQQELESFVIRPKDAWSMNCRDMPRDMKKPFGEDDSDRVWINRKSFYHWDWTTRSFRDGREDGKRRPPRSAA